MTFFSRKDRRATRSSSPTLTHRLQLETLEDRCLLSAGDLDLTFGSGGIVSNAAAYDVAVQADGKIVAIGSPDFSAARYLSNGSLDPTFGSGGKVMTKMGTGATAWDVGIYPNNGTANDGKIVVAGTAGLGGFNNHGFGLVRYNRDGSLDKTFNKTGKVTLDFSIGWDEARAVVIQPDGKIIAAGYSSLPDNCCLNSAFTLVRFAVNGTLDTTFGNGGKVITDVRVSEGSELIWDVALQTDGKIVAAGGTGGSGSQFSLARFNTDGSLDATFGSGGKVLTDPGPGGESIWGVALQTDGKIVAAGGALARYLGDSTIIAAATAVRQSSPTVTVRHTPAVTAIVTIASHEDARHHTARAEAADQAIASLLGSAMRRRFGPSHKLDLDAELLADIAILV